MNTLIKSVGIRRPDSNNYQHYQNCTKCGVPKNFISSAKTWYSNGLCRSCVVKGDFSRNQHRNKKVSLRFFGDEHVEKHKSISDFCRHHPELGLNAKYHFSQVLSGQRLHYKGWTLASRRVKVNPHNVIKMCQFGLQHAINKDIV
jgi:ribosomal protein S14